VFREGGRLIQASFQNSYQFGFWIAKCYEEKVSAIGLPNLNG
jgi:hypothetical protein